MLCCYKKIQYELLLVDLCKSGKTIKQIAYIYICILYIYIYIDKVKLFVFLFFQTYIDPLIVIHIEFSYDSKALFDLISLKSYVHHDYWSKQRYRIQVRARPVRGKKSWNLCPRAVADIENNSGLYYYYFLKATQITLSQLLCPFKYQ